MKSILLFLSLLIFNSNYAQRKANCYDDYLKLFVARKTFPLTDGEHNVVVTVRDLNDNTCHSVMGKIAIANGHINGKLFIKNANGSYIAYKKEIHDNYKKQESNLKLDLKIVNGMSANFLTKDRHVVNLFFIDVLKPKTPLAQEAPDVSSYR